VQIDCNVEMFGAEPPCPRPIVFPARKAVLSRNDEDAVDVRVAAYDGLGKRFNEVRDVGAWEMTSQSPRQRGCEDDVANQSEANKKDPAASHRGGPRSVQRP
jgi:hypothetical protein